ncbi:hypothetical protein K469DRAFT_149641 [Zopfia rhizophila CBS 207.26]|uniref:C2H2-type domain-containing protein n=1 Tax=Zopfia rhizophila CBS 207.26 TaxID=1314779 RepID=A0A6A6E2Z9_9PEZI|nr:hypothetical protein K469DRAFT_149641 [Zopfia rhizophila CBS 207.26]
MSGYQYPPSSGQSGYYSYPTSSNTTQGGQYQTTAQGQYTQAQLQAYYQKYGCYPGQPAPVQNQTAWPGYNYQQPGSPQTYYDASNNAYQQTQQQPNTAYQQYQTQPIVSSSTQDDQVTDNTPVASNRSNSRQRTWTCELPNCPSSAQFTRLADLQRHHSTVHGVGIPEFPCTVPRCTRVGTKGFTRRDHLTEHLRNFHHIDIPKRKPGERSANVYPSS